MSDSMENWRKKILSNLSQGGRRSGIDVWMLLLPCYSERIYILALILTGGSIKAIWSLLLGVLFLYRSDSCQRDQGQEQWMNTGMHCKYSARCKDRETANCCSCVLAKPLRKRTWPFAIMLPARLEGVCNIMPEIQWPHEVGKKKRKLCFVFCVRKKKIPQYIFRSGVCF